MLRLASQRSKGKLLEYQSTQDAGLILHPVVLIGGLQQWLKGDSLGTVNGASISSWQDFSGNSRHASSPGGSQPTVLANAQNGLSCSRYNGSSYFNLGNYLTGFTAGQVFIVVRASQDPNQSGTDGLWHIGNSASDSTRWSFTDGVIYDTFGTSSRKTTVNPSPSLTVFNIYSVMSKAGQWTSWLNNTQLYNTTSNAVSWPTTPRIGQGVGFSWSGDIAEFLLYNKELSTADRGVVHNYLKSKWGTP